MKHTWFAHSLTKFVMILPLITSVGCENSNTVSQTNDETSTVDLKIGLPTIPNAECQVKEQNVSLKLAKTVSGEEIKLALWASTLSYFPENLVLSQTKLAGLVSSKFIDMSKVLGPKNSGFQAFVAQTKGLRILAIRGSSEAKDWVDANFKDLPTEGSTFLLPGRVHSGFASQMESGFDEVVKALGQNIEPILITGHSLGGALATLFAGRLQAMDYPIARAISFAAPKSGDDVYGNSLTKQLGFKLIRAIKTDDLVPETPANKAMASIVAQIDKLGQSQEEIDKRETFLQQTNYTHAGMLYTLDLANGVFVPAEEPKDKVKRAYLQKILDLKIQAKSLGEDALKKLNTELDLPHGIGKYGCPLLGEKS